MGGREADAVKNDAEQLRGTRAVGGTGRGGLPATADQLKDAKGVFKGGTVALTPREEGAPDKESFKLDPAKTPKEIDMSGPDSDLPVRGIYEVTDGALKICVRPAGGKRPAAFEAAAGSSCLLFVLKRKEK